MNYLYSVNGMELNLVYHMLEKYKFHAPSGKSSPVNTTDLKAQYATQTAALKQRYDSLQVAYNGEEHNLSLTSNSTAEASPYYYHSDHLGSSSLITGADGSTVQHLEYVPYGEVFIDERQASNSWTTPYKFSGKERDEETGLLYFGARYQDSKYGIWYSVDPLAEKYPNMSSYVYCHDNPVNMIDPDGMTDFKNSKGETVKHLDDKSNAVFQQTGKNENLHYEFTGYNKEQGESNVVNLTSAVQEQQNLNYDNKSLQQYAKGENDKETHCNQATQNILKTASSALNKKGIMVIGDANSMIKALKENSNFLSVSQEEAEKYAAEGGLAIAGYKNPSGHGHVLTYSVGENREKGQVANIGPRSFTGFKRINQAIGSQRPKSYFILLRNVLPEVVVKSQKK